MKMHIAEFVRDAFSGRAHLSGNGREYNLPCPFHDEDRKRKKHLYLNAKTGKWLCFSCEERGNFPRLVRGVLTESPNLKYNDYIQDAEEDGDTLLRVSPPVEKRNGEAFLPVGFLPVWTSTEGFEGFRQQALAYLESRGVGYMEARLYEIGFAPFGRLGRRVIVPVRSMDARLVGWVARDITGAQAIKILSSSGNDQVSIKDHVFGLNMARMFPEIVLVEGVFDAIKHGTNFVALLGKAATEQQMATILKAKPKRITVLLDKDAPHDAKVLARRFTLHVPEVYVATLQTSKDPGAATTDEVQNAVSKAVRFS